MTDSAARLESHDLTSAHQSNQLAAPARSKLYVSPACRMKQQQTASNIAEEFNNSKSSFRGFDGRGHTFSNKYPHYPAPTVGDRYSRSSNSLVRGPDQRNPSIHVDNHIAGDAHLTKTFVPYRPPQLRQLGGDEGYSFNPSPHKSGKSYVGSNNPQASNFSSSMMDGRKQVYGQQRSHQQGWNSASANAPSHAYNTFNSGYGHGDIGQGRMAASTALLETKQRAMYNRSVTKTGWDVRSGRRYHPETERDVFGTTTKVQMGINFDSYDDIPVEMTGMGADKILPVENFQLTEGVHPLLMENVKRVKYTRPTPVQKHAIPTIMNGRDLMACAQTGSGKTAAFLFPVISCMLQTGPPIYQSEHSLMGRKEPAAPVCLVVSPTRELAVQIYQEARKFSFGTGIRTVVVYGGSDVRAQIYDLDKGCDICVATPGRLKDLMDRNKVRLACVRHLVLDEADRMLDMGFLPQMREIVLDSDMPANQGQGNGQGGRQTVMFSATFPREIQQLAREFLRNYIFLSVGRVGSTNNFIRQRLQYASDQQKLVYLLKILRESEPGLILVFVETKRKADQIEGSLVSEEVNAVSIHGDRSQAEREEALRRFKDGTWPVLVATDVAARGLDIPNITHVINFDVPNNIDDYVHRIGRTGRAGNKGLATSFVNETNWPVLRDLLGILEESNQEIPSWFHSMVMDTTSGGRTASGRGNRGHGSGDSSRNNGRNGSRDIRGGEHVSYNYGRSNRDKHLPIGHPGNAHYSNSGGNSNWRDSRGGYKVSSERSRGFESDMNGGLRDDAW